MQSKTLICLQVAEALKKQQQNFFWNEGLKMLVEKDNFKLYKFDNLSKFTNNKWY